MPRRARNASGGLLESTFQGKVISLMRFYAWQLVYHTHDSQRSQPGFPDVVAVRVAHVGRVLGVGAGGRTHVVEPGRVTSAELLFAEVKPENEQRRVTLEEAARRPEWLRSRAITHDQADWLMALRDIQGAVEEAAGADGWGPFVAVEAHVWTPKDWAAIEQRLARGRVLQHHPAP